MEKQFWHERWESNQIGFHQDEINLHLQEQWPLLNQPVGTRVFVPLCGKSRDMLWLLEQGYRVLGIELSPIAVEAFFSENKLEAKVSTQNGMQYWSCDELVIICGDFFSLTAEVVAECTSIYDRASLIAMPPAMRPAYTEKMQQLFPVPRPTLLISMSYPQHEMSGPPFSVTDKEVDTFYSAGFSIRTLMSQDILEHNLRFKERGITQLTETVYLLQPKDQ
ncbi:MAG: thiopurine S-methyltransferase [Sedimenticola thiotaurini]|uniref:Thiopurine S-methyltransferase n=1 Tax=Sedimenticola thiotaurini TaxID=1543721 RepID=A0A558CT15_9GAMM|nr:MAG: thiopurine S-methyltransferase [Sedimenticola thiotaurini]